MISVKLKEFKEAAHKRKEGGVAGGSSHTIQGNTFPSWDIIIG